MAAWACTNRLASHTCWITEFPVWYFSGNIAGAALQLSIPRCFHGRSAKLLSFYGTAFQINTVFQNPLLVTAAQDGDLTAQCNFHDKYDAFLFWERKNYTIRSNIISYNFIKTQKKASWKKDYLPVEGYNALMNGAIWSLFFPLMHF